MLVIADHSPADRGCISGSIARLRARSAEVDDALNNCARCNRVFAFQAQINRSEFQ
jgi:hypothetical protein